MEHYEICGGLKEMKPFEEIRRHLVGEWGSGFGSLAVVRG
jgi:hypothetical protein